MKMEKPTVGAVRFGSRDVIATSGERGVMLGGFDGFDWFVSNVKDAKSGTTEDATIVDYFNAASNAGFTEINYGDANFSLDGGSNHKSFSYVTEESGADYNGWYIWYNDGKYFGKQ